MLQTFGEKGFEPFAEEWRRLDTLADAPVRVISGAETTFGRARGVDLDGTLLVDVDGELRRFASGEVSLRRCALAFMALLIDIGNTRIKWARFEDGVLQPQSAAPHADWNVADVRRDRSSTRQPQPIACWSATSPALAWPTSCARRLRKPGRSKPSS